LYPQTHTWKDVSKKGGPWKSIEVDERMLYICSRYGTGRWEHKMEKVGSGRQEGPRLKKMPTCHIRRAGGGGGLEGQGGGLEG
jgi:hypothetical protein